MIGTVLGFLIFHIAMVVMSIRATMLVHSLGPLLWLYIFVVLAANAGGLLVFLSSHMSCNFSIPMPTEDKPALPHAKK